MAQPGFIFGAGTADTYESLQAKRKTAERLGLAAMRTPQNLGEGLSSLGQAIAYRRLMGQADRGEAAGKAAYDEKRQSVLGMLMGNQMGGGNSSTPSAYTAGPGIIPPDPSSPGAIGADAMAAIGKASFEPGDRDSFTSAMWPHALRVAEKTGLDPRLVVAQAAQETGWGKSAPGNNFFGVKSHGKPGGNTFATNEVVGGETVRINDSFRGYGSMGQSADDYAQFLLDNPRYKEMLSAPDLQGQVAALGRSGYATDPNYAASVGSIAGGIPGGSPMSTPGAGIPGITELLSDPYATEADKTVLGMLLQQQMEAMQPADPMQALDMEYKRAQIDQMNAPQGAETPDVETFYDEATGQQYKAQWDGAKWVRIGGVQAPDGPLVTFGGEDPAIGKLSTDYTYLTNPDGSIKRDENGLPMSAPVPGSPAYITAQETAKKTELRDKQAAAAASIVLQDIDKAIEQTSGWTAGAGGALTGMIPGSGARDLEGSLNTIKANIGFDRLQQMREASPTGGALGGIAVPELVMLQAVLGAITTDQSPEQLRANLKRLKEVYEPIAKKAAAYPNAEQFGFFGGGTGAPDGAAPPAEQSDEDFLKSLGLE